MDDNVHGPLPPAAITIRPVTDADGTAISQIISSVMAEYPGCLFINSEHRELRAPARHASERGGAMWLAEHDGRAVGVLLAVPSWRPEAVELARLSILPEQRERGIGRQFLTHATIFARATGRSVLEVWSDIRFREARGFFVRSGFVPQPGLRALHDASISLEQLYSLDLDR